MIQSGKQRSPEQQVALSNATELLNSGLPIVELGEHIAMLAEYHKAATPMTPEMSNDRRVNDRLTGLFAGEFLKSHLESQMIETNDYMLPLSFLSLQLLSPNDGNALARKTLPALAKVVLSQIRQTDCAGRLDWSTIGVSLRNTGYSGGVQLGRRILDKLGGEQLGALGLAYGSGCTLSWRVIERRAYHSAKDLIFAGTKGPQTRIIHAA